MFAEASSWNRPMLFRGRVGGHASVEEFASDAQKYAVKKLVYAHIGRPTIRSLDAGKHASFGEFGREGSLPHNQARHFKAEGSRQFKERSMK
jgi:hypothetical protein